MLNDRRGNEQAYPKYAELPIIEKLRMPHAWDVYGSGDELGSINRLTSDRVLDGIECVRDGEVISLDLPLDFIDPPMFERGQLKHEVFAPNRNEFEDRVDNLWTQASTQWDGLGHVRAREFGFWGGRTGKPKPGGPAGIEKWAEHGMVGRGVLLDVARYRASCGRELDPLSNEAITVEDLTETAQWQDIDVRSGDMLCVRTGWLAWYKKASAAERSHAAEVLRFPGLEATDAMAAFLWDSGVAALAADNPAMERSPGDPAEGSLHRRLIPLLGMAMGELFDFEALADRSAEDRRYAFLLVSVPLKLSGGVASPSNAVAIR